MILYKDVTTGERLLLERRRRQESQRQAAKRRGTTRYRYRRWETDREAGPRAALGSLRAHERCFLLRRRAGIPLHRLSKDVGVSRWWLCQMEYGLAPAGRLTKFWRGKKRHSRARKA